MHFKRNPAPCYYDGRAAILTGPILGPLDIKMSVSPL
jgi:hypothetical protein